MASPRAALAFGIVLLAALLPGPVRAQEETVLFLVRHAERAEDGSNDPHISSEGKARAELLAELLRDAGITHVHSSDYHRTRETAAPLAAEAGVELEIYDPGAAEAFSAHLWATPGRHLVVGHSNTIPALVRALGGEPGPEIQGMEYDRLYVLTRGPRGVNTVLLRFGAPFRG